MSTMQLKSIKSLPIIATGAALATCYGTLCLTLLLPAIGIPFAVPEGPWALSIVLLTALAVLAFAFRARRHHNWRPFTLAMVGAAAITWVMCASYYQLVEITGFALMIAAAVWDRRIGAGK